MGGGLLRVSLEVVLYAAWSLAPTCFIRFGLWLGRRGQCAGAGQGGVPGHVLGDDDVDPAQ